MTNDQITKAPPFFPLNEQHYRVFCENSTDPITILVDLTCSLLNS